MQAKGEIKLLEASTGRIVVGGTGRTSYASYAEAWCKRCGWHRDFGSGQHAEQNAVTRLAEHLMAKHRVKLMLILILREGA